MFDIGWSELFFLAVVAVVVVGPKDLPRLMRTVGQWTGRARQMADQFRRSFDDMARQAELEEMRAEVLSKHDEESLRRIQRETDLMLGHSPMDDRPHGLENFHKIEEDPNAKPSIKPPADAAKKTPDAASETAASKPDAPEPQSPLHRDEP